MVAELKKMNDILDEAEKAEKTVEAENAAMPQQTGIQKASPKMSRRNMEILYKDLYFKNPRSSEDEEIIRAVMLAVDLGHKSLETSEQQQQQEDAAASSSTSVKAQGDLVQHRRKKVRRNKIELSEDPYMPSAATKQEPEA